MPDLFEENMSGLDSPATNHFAITPANTDFAITPRAIYCGGAGNVEVRDQNNVDVIYAVAAGTYLMIRAKQVRTAGTTATGLVGLY